MKQKLKYHINLYRKGLSNMSWQTTTTIYTSLTSESEYCAQSSQTKLSYDMTHFDTYNQIDRGLFVLARKNNFYSASKFDTFLVIYLSLGYGLVLV